MHRSLRSCSALISLIVACCLTSFSLADQPFTNPEMQTRIKSTVEFLASDEMRGRSVEGETIHEAAKYIRDQFKQFGLDVEQYGGTGMQDVEINLGTRPGPKENNFAEFIIDADSKDSREIKAQLAEGMNPLGLGAQAGQFKGKVVFAGYGITAPRMQYDDYQDIDATDAIVIVIRKEPRMNRDDSKFQGKRNTRHAFFTTKVENAINHGAAAVIIVNDPASVANRLAGQQARIGQETARQKQIKEEMESLPKEASKVRESLKEKLARSEKMVESMKSATEESKRGVLGVQEAGRASRRQKVVPVLSVARDTISQLLKAVSKKSLADLESAIDENETPQSFALTNVAASIEVELTPSRANGKNVIGILPGRGPLAEETIVIGAHYDHVGMGGAGSLAPGTIAVHNGADDNASGTTAMIETARALTKRLADKESRRRIVFMAFTGEERGLLGSRYYVEHPLFPIDETVAMLNLDMVGRLNENELTVYGTGTAENFDDLIETTNDMPGFGFKLAKIPTGFGPSDHQSFYAAGIPVLFLFTGLHDDYHRPTDDADKVNYEGMTRITNMVIELGEKIALGTPRPKYVRIQQRSSPRSQLRSYIGVTLGQEDERVILSSIAAGGPAEKAGLKQGDHIDMLGKKKLKSSNELLEHLRTLAPGDTVEVTVIRDAKPIKVKVVLARRPAQP